MNGGQIILLVARPPPVMGSPSLFPDDPLVDRIHEDPLNPSIWVGIGPMRLPPISTFCLVIALSKNKDGK